MKRNGVGKHYCEWLGNNFCVREKIATQEVHMRHLASILWLSILVVLVGCGAGGRASGPASGPASGSTPPASDPVNNWQFSTTSTVPGMPPLAIAGSISVSGSSANGAVHVTDPGGSQPGQFTLGTTITGCPPYRPGRALISASGSYRR